MFGVNQVIVSDVINDAPVGFFGHIFIKTAVSGLHVENGNMQALSHVGSKTGIGITQYKEGIRLFVLSKPTPTFE